jgi:putative heme-binding domain-containing protein
MTLAQQPPESTHAAKASSGWWSYWGLAALACAAVAVVFGVLTGVKSLTLALATVGLALALTAVWANCRSARKSRWGIIASGAVCSAAVLGLGLAAPGLLNSFWAMDALHVEAVTDQLEAVPREDALKEGKPLTGDDWANAVAEAIRQDDLVIQIEGVRMGQLPERGSESFLLVHFVMTQFKHDRTVKFERYTSTGVTPRLTDETGRSYRFIGERVRKPPSKFDVLLKVDHLLLFEPAPPTVRSLKLELPAAAWQREGVCRFLLTKIEHEPPPPDFGKLIAQTKSMLRKPPQSPPDLALGRTLFVKNCQECHTIFGAGGKVGPDLANSKRDDLDFLLTSIINPSAVIEKPYQTTLILTTSGVVYNGIVKQQSEHSVLLMLPNKPIEIPREEIETMRESKISLMPTDLLKPLSEHEVRSLVAYLQGKKQTALIATPDNAPYFIFYEQNLSNWQVLVHNWTARDGEIATMAVPGGKPGQAVSLLHIPGDFHFTVRLRPAESSAGAVILSDAAAPLPRGPRIEFAAGRPLTFTGFKTDGERPELPPLVKDDWNRVEVIATGGRIHVRLNDAEAFNALDDPPVRRAIALEGSPNEQNVVRFRNLDLRVMAGSK